MSPSTRPKLHVLLEAPFGRRVSAARVRAAGRAALDHQGVIPPCALTVRLGGDESLRQLNREFLGHDYATDVLSFPAGEVDDQGRYLGDVAISVPRAEAQAQAGGHPLSAEIELLVVHGVLHLLGHDHSTRADRTKMWRAQAEILAALGAPISGPAPSPRQKKPPARRANRR